MYKIKSLYDNILGELGGMTALFFDGAVCEFIELPKPTDTEGLERVYRYIDSIRKSNNND